MTTGNIKPNLHQKQIMVPVCCAGLIHNSFLMRYNYRHVSGVQYDKTFDQQGGNYVANYSEMLTLAMTAKYSSVAAMATKMPTEPYLYWPINTGQMDVNTKLKQNPVWKASASSSRN